MQTPTEISERMRELAANTSHYLETFENHRPLTGPEIYFHHKILEIISNSEHPPPALSNDQYVEYLYATLTAWGMHGRVANLVSFVDFKEKLTGLLEFFDTISSERIDDLSLEAWEFADVINQVIYRFAISETGSQVVTGSKCCTMCCLS